MHLRWSRVTVEADQKEQLLTPYLTVAKSSDPCLVPRMPPGMLLIGTKPPNLSKIKNGQQSVRKRLKEGRGGWIRRESAQLQLAEVIVFLDL